MNRRIIIDESDAQEAIRRIHYAREKLEEAGRCLSPAGIDAERLRGKTRDALEQQFTRMTRDLSQLESLCDEAVNIIRRTVSDYQAMDSEYAERARELM